MVAHKILVSPPVPWIGDLGIGDRGLTFSLDLTSVMTSRAASKQLKIFDEKGVMSKDKEKQ